MMVTRSVRTNERTNERGGRTARKHNAFADTVEWRRNKNRNTDDVNSQTMWLSVDANIYDELQANSDAHVERMMGGLIHSPVLQFRCDISLTPVC